MRCSGATLFSFVAVTTALTTLAPRAGAEPPAHAPASDKERCVAAFDRGQRAQSDRALRRAQSELIVCAQESCPSVLRADCAGVLAEVQTALPTIVLAADDGNGHELTDVKVFVGAVLVAPRLDGRAIPVDPGTFELRFETAGRRPVVTSRTIREGEKSRVIRVALAGTADTSTTPPSRGADGAADAGVAAGPSARRSTLGWVLPGSLAAVGLAGLGVALYTRLEFDARVDDLRASCAPDCTQGQRSELSGTLVASNVALGVGLGALALGVATWFFTAPSSSSSSSSRGLHSRSGGFAW